MSKKTETEKRSKGGQAGNTNALKGNEARPCRIALRITDKQKKVLDKLSKQHNKTISSIVLDAIENTYPDFK